MDDLASLGVKVDASDVGEATKLLDKFVGSAGKTTSSVALMEEGFKKLLIILGPAAIAGALAGMVNQAIKLQESYVRLSEIAGTLPSQIAALDLPARLAGTSLDSVAQSVARLSRSIGEAQLGEAGGKRSLLKALGIDPNDGADPVDRFVQLSRSIMSMKDANVQAYVSQQFLSRGFSEMRPLMREVVEQGGLIKRTNDEDTRAAKAFEDQMVRLRYEMDLGKMKMANDYVPWLTDVAKAFTKGYEQGGLLEGVVRSLQTAMTGNDLYKANKEMVDTFNQMQAIQSKIEQLRQEEKQGVPAMGGGSFGPLQTSDYWTKQLAALQEKYNTARNYRDQLEALSSQEGKGGGAGGSKAEEQQDTEAKVRKMMDDKLHYEERIAASKGFAERYSAAIATQNALIKEQRKQEEISEEESVQRQSYNEDLRLQVMARAAREQIKLHEGQNERTKAQEGREELAKVNAAMVANYAITGAQVNSIRSQQDIDWVRGIAQRAAAQTDFFKDSQTKLEGWLAEENNLNEIARNIGLRDQEEYESRYAEIHAYYAEQRVRIDDEETKKRFKINQVHRSLDLNAAGTFFGYMKGLMSVKSKELFEIGKLGAIGETVVNTYTAAMGAYKALSSIPYVGPALGAAAAAAAIAYGMTQVAQIKATPYGGTAGGGGAAVPTFNANATTGLPTQNPLVNQGASAGETPTLQVIINGHILGTQDFVDNVLLPAISDAVNNRDFVIFGPNSRQAANVANVTG